MNALTFVAVAVLAWLACPAPAGARTPQTVCTLTVNSADEQEAFRRHLPASKVRFVELVQPGRTDWLDAACRADLRCDVLILSAHFDGAEVFYGEQSDRPEHLTGADLERVSCSESCRPLFSQLQEVYLFGCNTLNPTPQSDAPAEVLRSLQRAGHSAAQARRELQSLTGVHAESRRDRMRQIFAGVPVIYGFRGAAPLGPVAAAALHGHLRQGGDRDFGSGRVSARLLEAFAPFGLVAAPGLGDELPLSLARANMCRFADQRLSAATRLAFVHDLLQRPVGEVRLYLDRIQGLVESLDLGVRQQPGVAEQLEAIARDDAARARLLDYARQTDRPPVRVQLLDLARDMGWLTHEQWRGELALLLDGLQQRRDLGVAEVHLACGLNPDGRLDSAAPGGASAVPQARDVASAALRACRGSAADRARLLQVLLEGGEADVRVAQAYLRHRPVIDAIEQRRLVDSIAALSDGAAQVQALEALSRSPVSDRDVLIRLAGLFAQTPSAAVQSSVAGILIRADLQGIDAEGLMRTLVDKRLPAPDGGPLIELLLDVLQSR